LEKILELSNIHFAYGDNEALSGVDFDLYEQEIHSLTGDHRSGKSTLAKILGGSLRNQSGDIRLRGVRFSHFTPKTSIDNRIGVVYQNPEVMPNLSVLDNIYAGRMPHFLVLRPDKERMRASCERLFRSFGIDIDPETPLHRLSQANQQIISIARVLSLGAEILILDEIGQRLTPSEMNSIYGICRRIKSQGKSIIYITSNIDEVYKIADRVTVFRGGYRRGTEKVEAVEPSRLVNLAYDMAYAADGDGVLERPALLFTKQQEAIIKDLPIGMIVLDAAHEVRVINTSAEKIFGLRDGLPAVLGIDALLERLKIGETEEILTAIRQRKHQVNERLATSDDRILRLKSIPLFDASAAFLGTNVFVEDVSVEYDTKEYLLRAEQMASGAELAAGVAHEINNPLGIIQNYVQLIALQIDDPGIKDTLSQIQRELDRIVEIIGSLLSFSRVKQNPLRRLSLNDLLDEVVLLLSHKLKDKNVSVSRRYPAAPVVIMGYENRLKQLFMNLITNSIEAVLTGGTIEITVELGPAHVEVSVCDNGHGIPEDIQGEVFKPFFSTKMSKTNTGLGLSICQHIAESHKGIITFDSRPGERTRFTVRLPLERKKALRRTLPEDLQAAAESRE
jgi:two-component system sensor histidine kinase AtoS